MSRKLEEKVAVVTGASKGIGAAIAKALADEGASVIVNYSSSKQGADRVVEEISGRGGKAIAAQGDVSKQADIERLFSAAQKAFGRLDILVNNAGVYELAPLEEVTAELFHKTFNLNVLGLLLTTKEAVKHMGPEGGSIINIGSVASALRPPNSTVYAGLQGCRRGDYGRAGKRAWSAEDSGKLDLPGDDRDGRGACHGLLRQRLPEDGRDAGASRTHRATRRYRADSRLSGVVGLQVHDRRDPAGVGRLGIGGTDATRDRSQ